MLHANRRYLYSLGFLLSLIFPFAAIAKSDSDLQEELAQLKDDLLVMQDQVEEINQSASNRMSISGYTDLEMHNSSEQGKKPGFRLHHLSLFFEKTIAQKWKFFSEIEFEDAPKFEGSGEAQPDPAKGEIVEDAKGKIFVEAVNVTYQHQANLNIRAGRFFTPAGIWSVDHYPSFVPTQLRPQHIREIFPQVVDGLLFYGTQAIGSSFLDYHIYSGNGEGNTGKQDLNSEKSAGLRLAIILPWMDYFELGLSGYKDTLNTDTQKLAAGAHIKMELANFTFQSEYAKAELEPELETDYASTGYYAQLLYNIGSATLGLRHDYFEPNDSEVDTGKTYDGIFFNYHVNDSVVLKLEHYDVSFDNKDKDSHVETIGSLVIYLGN